MAFGYSSPSKIMYVFFRILVCTCDCSLTIRSHQQCTRLPMTSCPYQCGICELDRQGEYLNIILINISLATSEITHVFHVPSLSSFFTELLFMLLPQGSPEK